ncbi:hypothetical protein EW093_07195 [Thiospirochaeta perfilievii]|uniref:Iron-containing alcohol dehydrogenase n=1 Tax=Thiospirochaeta perfilievii TaxID=252967 RepID=A0A5C1Q8R9_9SPIO|nr:iron-containing alcohol dehydrogenase [Thiospirochaeta perfilievii]QEN04493.1 hypothetical protein EW093_07195 [Thiospirochaeta perfilievii]
MFTLSKSSPELYINSNTPLELGNKLKDIGGRILLICSTNVKDKHSIETLKKSLKSINLTFIQYDQKSNFISHDELKELQIRAENFNVSSIISIGDINERMSGRYLAQTLSLYYFELPTTYNNPYLLIPQAIFANRIGTKSQSINLSYDRINSIEIANDFLRQEDDIDSTLNSISMLLVLAELFTNKENNPIAKYESRNLFLRLLDDVDNKNINSNNLLRYGLTVALYHGASTLSELNITEYTWLVGSRFKCSPHIIGTKLLPRLLEINNEEELSIKIMELLHSNGLSNRLADLGYTLKQFSEINSDNSKTMEVVERAF